MTPQEDEIDLPIAAEVLGLISGRELVIQHFGEWPSFHDSEVISIKLERALVMAVTHTLCARFFVYDNQKEKHDPHGKQALVELLFESVDNNLKIEGFNWQNPVTFLSIELVKSEMDSRLFRVAWGGSGLHHEVAFDCAGISVLQVIELNPFCKPYPFI